MSRLLLLENHHAGDAVLALPFLRGATQVFAEVAVCCTAGGAEIFRTAGIRNLIALGSSSIASLATLRQVRAFRPSVAASVWSDARLHLLMRLSGAAVRAGFPMTDVNFYGAHLPWRRRLRQGQLLASIARLGCGRLLTQELQRKGPLQSHCEDWLQLGQALGVTCDFRTPWLAAGTELLAPDTRDRLRAAKAEGRTLIAIHHGGRLATKRWPADRFTEVARRLASRPATQLVAVEPPDVPPLPISGPNVLSSAPGSIAALVALLAACDVVLCNDSLAAHLGAALGKRVVSIFGSGHPAWFAPYGSGAWTVRAGECPYNPCLDHCLMGRPICLEQVTVEQVMATLQRCLEAPVP